MSEQTYPPKMFAAPAGDSGDPELEVATACVALIEQRLDADSARRLTRYLAERYEVTS